MKKLTVDGIGGASTITRLQEFLGVKQYGEITIKKSLHKWCPGITAVEYGDEPSGTVKALQKWLGFKNPDGKWGEITSRNLQKKIGINNTDGIFGKISVEYLQKYLNAHEKATYPSSKFKSSKTIIGHAAASEYGGLTGGKAGDQTGREVCYSNWSYSATKGAYSHWMYVFRAKDKDTRLKLAQAMMDTVENNNIGYDTAKPDRYSAYDAAEANGHNIRGISRKCETTCSQAVSMCMRAAGIPKEYAPRHFDIVTMTKVMTKSPYFYMYTSSDYTKSSLKLEPGDIVLSGHHTAIVVKSPRG